MSATGCWRVACGAAAVMLLFGATGAAADGSPSSRARVSDLHEADWSGFYIGGQLGGAWSSIDWQYQNANYFDTLGPVVVGNNFSHDPDGVIGGVLGGYNYQTGPWVLGLEIASSAADLQQLLPSPLFPKLDVSTNRINWLATATGRLGYAWDRWLVFAKGGWAGADVKLTLADRSAAVYGSDTAWANGWSVGGGAEYLLCDWVSLGIAYDYADLSIANETVTCPACVGPPAAGFGTPIVDGDIVVQSLTARVAFLLGQ